ncbi:hypothetical protein LINPERHAP1_LOCUS36727 [Linum perenne]
MSRSIQRLLPAVKPQQQSSVLVANGKRRHHRDEDDIDIYVWARQYYEQQFYLSVFELQGVFKENSISDRPHGGGIYLDTFVLRSASESSGVSKVMDCNLHSARQRGWNLRSEYWSR